jgi:hypothetical protein
MTKTIRIQVFEKIERRLFELDYNFAKMDYSTVTYF